MESNSNAGQPTVSDPHFETVPVAQTISCCTDGHHHHSHSSLNNVGFHSLAMTVSASPASPATPHQGGASRAHTSVGKSSGSKNRKRKRTSRACVYCQKLHLSCDEQRPCIRCVKAGRADQCKDGKRKRRGRKRKSMPVDEEAMDEDMDVDIDTIGGGGCCSHSEEEDYDDEEVSSSSATAPAVHSPRHDDDSVDLSTNSSLESSYSSPAHKRRAVGLGAEPTNWRSPNELMADNDAECEIASMLLSLQSRAPAIKVFS